MPIEYTGILNEHKQTRTACSLFDICHMGEFRLSGPTAGKDLERLLTQSVESLEIGQCRYGFLLNEQGGVLDDLTCYRLGEDSFYLVVNAATCEQDATWIQEHLSPTTRFDNESGQTAKLDIQGPAAREKLEEAFGIKAPPLKYFRCTETSLLDTPCILSRTGYTGEFGYEIYFPAEAAERFWDTLVDNAGIPPAGLGARDTLRLEMGYPLYGHELSIDRSPVAATQGAFIDTTKAFIGEETVRQELDQGTDQLLTGLRLDTRRAARAGDVVEVDDQVVGKITSGSLAPSLGVAVGMAYIDRAYCNPGKELTVRVRKSELKAVLANLPFYKEGTARQKSAS